MAKIYMKTNKHTKRRRGRVSIEQIVVENEALKGVRNVKKLYSFALYTFALMQSRQRGLQAESVPLPTTQI